jgi:hypothetical protein
LAGALIPLKGTAPANFNFASSDYSRETGVIGNGSTKYLNSNRNQASDPQNSSHLAIYVSNASTGGSGTYSIYAGAGSGTGPSASYLEIARYNNSSGLTGVPGYNRTSTYAEIASLNATGFIGCSRNSSLFFTGRSGGVNTTVNQVSSAPGNVNVAIFAENYNGAISGYTNARIAFYSIGESLTLSLLDSRVSTLLAAIAAAIP